MAHTTKLFSNSTRLLKGSVRYNSSQCEASDPNFPPSPYCLNNYCPPPALGTMYQRRKYNHSLPGYQIVCPPFETLPLFPNDVFRYTEGEELGPGAGKCRVYKNPEYFSFHHMTFYDMHLLLRFYRQPSKKSGRKPAMNTYYEGC